MRTSPKTKPVMACDYDDEGLGTMASSSGAGSGPGVTQDEDDEGERKRKRKTNSGGAKKKDEDDTATLLKRIRTFSCLHVRSLLIDQRTWKRRSRLNHYEGMAILLLTQIRHRPLLLSWTCFRPLQLALRIVSRTDLYVMEPSTRS
jgi:hypothetical protein